MFNTALVVCWTISYALIVIYSICYRREKLLFMPLAAGLLNFAWEVNALLALNGYSGHWAWLILDCGILAYNLYVMFSAKRSWGTAYLAAVLAAMALMNLLFRYVTLSVLLSSFVIDIIMALEYLITVNRLSERGQIPIGAFRVAGDLCAWIAFMNQSQAVVVMGLITLFINAAYIVLIVKRYRSGDKASDESSGWRR